MLTALFKLFSFCVNNKILSFMKEKEEDQEEEVQEEGKIFQAFSDGLNQPCKNPAKSQAYPWGHSLRFYLSISCLFWAKSIHCEC